MNYLAHVFLSGNDPLITVGNLIGDMIKNKEIPTLHPTIQEGILLHRFIDSYTDNHPNVLMINKYMRATQGKYAPVSSDILMDYILANHWNKYSGLPFDDWCLKAYNSLDDHYSLMPPYVKKRVASMINGKWLHSYKSTEGILYTFSRIAKRARFSNQFENAFQTYLDNKKNIDEQFDSFFPEIIFEVQKRMLTV